MNILASLHRYAPLAAKPLPSAAGIQILGVDIETRRVRATKGGHIRGYEPLGAGRRSVVFESLLERAVIRALVRFPQLRDIRAQPMTVRYTLGGKLRRYTPDFLVLLSEVPPELKALGFGLHTIVEAKAAALFAFDRERVELGIRALIQARREPVVLLTEWELSAGALEVRDGQG
jgi:hypothetical protein